MLPDFTPLIVDSIARARKIPVPLTTLVDVVRVRAYGVGSPTPYGVHLIIKQREAVRRAIVRAEAEGDIVSCAIQGGDGYQLAQAPVDEPAVQG